MAGRRSQPGQLLLRWFEDSGRDVGRDAFLAAGLAHTLEIDDLHKASVTHPGCIVIPVAWYLARQRGASGREFLVAVLHGYEAMTRVGMAAGPGHYQVWHATSTCGVFGAAMAAATLMALDRRQTVWALGSAGTQSSGLWQFLSDGVMSKHLHAARAAEAGVTAAGLAAVGFSGAERILEGEQGFFRALCPDAHPDALLHEPTAPWQLRNTSIKPWPCCRHTHPAIDAALDLHARVGGEEPAAVDVCTYQAALDVCDRPSPHTPYAAKFSLQHCVNVALADGAVDFTSFDAPVRARLAASSARTHLSTSPAFDDDYPERWGAEVKVHLSSGQTLSARRLACKGDPELPLSVQEMTDKARMLIRFGGLDRTTPDVVDELLALPHAAALPTVPLAP